MNNKSNQVKYGLIAKTYHWGFVVLFVYGIFKQVQDIEQLGDNSLLRFELIFALIFIALLTIRFFYMKKTQQSSLPEDTPKIQKMAARIVHNSMYICLFLVLITGIFVGLSFAMGLKNGFLIDAFIGLHEFSIQAIYWLIGIHISAAIFHRIRKDGIWSSMVPFLKEK
jgi:cytochrome b561